MKNLLEQIEASNISVYPYKEGKKLCGYELNTYTNGGVNQIVFIDFRNPNKKPKDKNDFKELFLNSINNIDIDNEIDTNRQNKLYCDVFTIRESLEDFEDWKNNLLKLAKSLK